ncbi:hypothetical protein ACHAWF_012410 [Thalassiosira exigua]
MAGIPPSSRPAPRPPLLPWSSSTWSDRWAAMGRLSATPVPRTPFLLLKAPASTLYEEKFGGDRNMFTVAMYCARMAARSIRVGLVVDCTALDLEEFEPLPPSKAKTKFDRRVRYFHNPSEWDDFDVEYRRLSPPKSANGAGGGDGNNGDGGPLAPKILEEFCKVVSDFMQRSRMSSSNHKVHVALFDSRGGLGAAAYLAAAYMCKTLRAPVHAAIQAVGEGTPSQPNDDPKRKWGLMDLRLVQDLQTRYQGRKEIRQESGTPSWWWAMDEDDEDEDEDENDSRGDAETSGQAEGENSAPKRKRKRDESLVIPPCDASSAGDDRTKLSRNDHDDSQHGGRGLHPQLPREALDPVPKDSPRWTRALTVLSQLTSTSSSDSTAMTTLPLKQEVDISDGKGLDIAGKIKNNGDQYRVTWLSTEGRKGLLLILSEAAYFIEQSAPISVSVVHGMKFPTPKDSKPHHRTLLDVVLVKDVERGKPTHRFYALDIICVEGGMVYRKPWEQRLRYLHEGVLAPRKRGESRHASVYAKEPIKIRVQEHFPIRKLGFVMDDVCAGVAHKAEGVRIVPAGAYGIGQEGDDTTALVWRKGTGVDPKRLKELLFEG